MTFRPLLSSFGALLAVSGLVLAGCSATSDNDHSSMDDTDGSTGSATSATSTAEVLALASWGDNVTISFSGDTLNFQSDGIPNHDRQGEYAVPNGGVQVPDETTASAVADPTTAQNYDFTITTTPVLAEEVTAASLGTIGVMISGAALFNPYEGDGSTVATASNFTVLNDSGDEVAFLDSCSGHPTPMGTYHYHALPKCVTATVDEEGGPSHLIGVAFDGFPIYGDRDIDGNQVTADQLDECNGIFSATPEFPDGFYHYVLLDTADETSSIKCFSGVVDESLTSAMSVMPGMGPNQSMNGPKP